MPLIIAPVLVVMYEALAGWLVRLAAVRGVGWVAANVVVTGVSLGRPEDYKRFRDDVFELGSALALEFAGLSLDKSDPFSDKSLCDAIGEKTGVALRTLKDRESVKKDVEHWALAKLEEKTGLHIRDVRDKPGVVKDVMRYASPVVADATGVPLSDISDKEKVREEVTTYLKDRALVVLAQDIERVKVLVNTALESTGTTLEQLAADITAKGGVDPVTGLPNVRVDVAMIALGVLSRALVEADNRRRAEEAVTQKVSRRKEQMRAALKRFREKHGSRMHYEPVT